MRQRSNLPLHGIRIVACEALMALPFGTQLLADFGADVIDIEHANYRDDSDTRWRLRTGRHKRRIAVNLRDPRGQEIVRQLAMRAEVFAENYRPGVMDNYNLGYKDLSVANPGLLYVSVSGFGHKEILESPNIDLASYGPIGEAMGGVAHSMGVPRDRTEGIAFGDLVTTLFTTIGILIAVRDRERTGLGQYLDMSMADCLLAFNERAVLMHVLSTLQEARDARDKEQPMMAGWGFHDLEAQDGRYTLGLMDESHWKRFCKELGHPEWIVDPAIADKRTRKDAIRETVIPVVNEWARSKSKFEVTRILQQAGLAAAPVLNPGDLLKEPHVAARRMLVDIEDEHGVRMKAVGNPIKLSRVEAGRQQETAQIASPGGDTVQILRAELGMTASDIQELLATGIVRE